MVMDGVIFELQQAGGITRYFTELLRQMDHRPQSGVFDVFVTTRQPGLPSSRNVRQVVFQDYGNLLPRSRFTAGSRAKLRSVSIRLVAGAASSDIWHSTYYTSPLGWQGPIITTVHDCIYEKYPALFNRTEVKTVVAARRESLVRSERVCCVSEATRRDVHALYGIPLSHIVVVPPAISASFTDADFVQQRERSPFVLYVGGRAPHKNFDFLLHSYQTWKLARDFKLVIAGPPPAPREEERIATLGLANRVTFVRWPNDRDLAQLYGSAAALVHPSLYEGFGIPILEALFFGCPLAASSIPSSREVAGDTAFYFDPREETGLHAALTAAVRSQIPRADLANRARAYSWAASAARMEEVYREVRRYPSPEESEG